MKSELDTLRRRMSVVRILEQAGVPMSADDLFSKLADSRSFLYPDSRDARMRQLQRDIPFIADVFGIVIERVGKSNYVIADRVPGTVDYNRLFADFDLLTALNPDSGINRHIIPERSRNMGSEHLSEVLNAIKFRRVIEFSYVNYRTGCSERRHSVAPHFLKEDQGLWYVVGYEGERLLIFGLDRMKDLDITDEEFAFDENIDIENYFTDCYGIWNDPAAPVEEIELKYDSLDGSFLKARPLHPSQKVIADNADEFRITVRLKITNDFVMELLKRSRSLEVVRPLHLRERVRDVFAGALGRNS